MHYVVVRELDTTKVGEFTHESTHQISKLIDKSSPMFLSKKPLRKSKELTL